VKKVKGIPRLFINGRENPPLILFGNPAILGTGGTVNTFAYKENPEWKAVYASCTQPTREFLRNVARLSGVNVFLDTGDVVFGNDDLLVIHTQKGISSQRTIHFCRTVDVYDYFDKRWYKRVPSVTRVLEGATTSYFFYGDKKTILDKKFSGVF